MKKLNLKAFFILVASFGLLTFCFAQQEVTITTYYPAPYGVYNELEARKLVIGEDGIPSTDGVVNFQGLPSDPSDSADRDDGALYYNSSAHEFRYYDEGSGEWQGLGGFSDFVVVQNQRSLGGGSGGVRVHCPEGYIRIGCSGGMDYRPSAESFWDSGDEDAKGYNGAAPIGTRGCTAFADGGSNVYVWAYCIRR